MKWRRQSCLPSRESSRLFRGCVVKEKPRRLSALQAGQPAPRRDNSLVQLTLVRFREFWREPEAVFWVFVFPVLLAAGLGIAFRNRPPDTLKVAATAQPLAAALRTEKLLAVELLDPAAGERALRTGRIVLLALPAPGGGITYRYDDTNPDGRAARLLADRAIQKAAGAPETVHASDNLSASPARATSTSWCPACWA